MKFEQIGTTSFKFGWSQKCFHKLEKMGKFQQIKSTLAKR